MSTATMTREEHLEDFNRCRFGMIVFLISEAMLFIGLIASYVVYRMSNPDFIHAELDIYRIKLPDVTTMNVIMLMNTVILIGSSFTYHFAEVALIKGKKGVIPLMLLTILMGSIFLGVQGYEWLHLKHEGLWINTASVYGANFFTLTGFHGAHVTIGVLLLIWVLIKIMTGNQTRENHTAVMCVGLYWHFVDVVWVFLFTVLYLW
ncbi:MAG: heme-copper oxidase subunit III [Verrucomicrobiae bacterium]|nr:heme-copper oxidase subunit III [Verrucomicrobiae bacterium]